MKLGKFTLSRFFSYLYGMVLLWILSLPSVHLQGGEPPPNIIILFADDLSWVDTSVEAVSMGHSSRYHETPHLERLAEEGITFSHAYVQHNCMPSRVSLLSGQYAPANDVYNVGSLQRPLPEEEGKTALIPPEQHNNLVPDSYSMGELLRDAGYVTAFFGKQHGVEPAEDLGVNHGFEHNGSVFHRFPLTYEGDGWKARHVRNYLALQDMEGKWHFPSPKYQRYASPYNRKYIETHLQPVANGNDPFSLLDSPPVQHPVPKHLTDAITDAVEDFIVEQAKRDSPFFIYLAYHLVHSDYVARYDLEGKYHRRRNPALRHHYPTYAAMVEHLDQSIGRILNALEDPGTNGDSGRELAENTVIVFLSDNGGSDVTDNAPLRGKKGMFYEGGIRVPLIIRYPPLIKGGRISDEPVHAIDFYPTVAELANIPLPAKGTHKLDGESLVGIMTGNQKSLDRDSIFWHFPGYMDVRQRPNSVVRTRINGEDYKLFYYYEEKQFELYNLNRDLGEKHNLLHKTPSPKTEEVAEALSIKLRNWLQQSGARMGIWRATGKPVAYPHVYSSSLQ